jgi:hypothetical protein
VYSTPFVKPEIDIGDEEPVALFVAPPAVGVAVTV